MAEVAAHTDPPAALAPISLPDELAAVPAEAPTARAPAQTSPRANLELHVVSIAKELAAATDEPTRDRLIEELTLVLHGSRDGTAAGRAFLDASLKHNERRESPLTIGASSPYTYLDSDAAEALGFDGRWSRIPSPLLSLGSEEEAASSAVAGEDPLPDEEGSPTDEATFDPIEVLFGSASEAEEEGCGAAPAPPPITDAVGRKRPRADESPPDLRLRDSFGSSSSASTLTLSPRSVRSSSCPSPEASAAPDAAIVPAISC